jgi:proteasome beta subunit
MAEPEIMTGTTTIGIVFKDGVVLATEKRATMGRRSTRSRTVSG